MTNNILCNSTFLGVGKQMEPNTIELRKSGKEILTIHADGRITVSEDLKPTETAAEVLQIMRDQWLADAQCTKIRELQGRIKRLEAAGDALKAAGYFGGFGDAVNKWNKAKEAKP